MGSRLINVVSATGFSGKEMHSNYIKILIVMNIVTWPRTTWLPLSGSGLVAASFGCVVM